MPARRSIFTLHTPPVRYILGPALLLLALAACAPQAAAPVPTDPPSVPPAAAPTETAIPAVEPTDTPTIPAPTETPLPTVTPIPLADTPARTAYSLPPVVQHVTETGATLLFELQSPAEGAVLFWPVDDPGGQEFVPFAAGRGRHQIELDDLRPETRYQVIVGLKEDPAAEVYHQALFAGALWDPITFSTAPADRPLRVGVIGDSGFGTQVTYDLAARMADHDLDFVLHTGDVVYQIYNDADAYEAYALKWYLPFAPLLRSLPIYPVVGNHDVEAAALWQGMPFYYIAFPSFHAPGFPPSDYEGRNQWYAFAYRDVQFLMLNTQAFFGEPGRAEQNAWLAERLADERFAHSIPVFHVPPFSSGMHAGSGLAVQSWVPLFEEARVPLVLSGHDHNYERLIVNNITYVISGGGSAVLYEQKEEHPGSQIYARRSHFVLLEIYPDRIDLQAIAVDGEVLDTATIDLE